MATASQTEANRKNSRRSTGPTTASGKAASSLNSLKHGLASSQLIIPGESEEAFNTLLTALITEHQPATTTETLLVEDMAKHHWLASRALRLQSEAIANTFSSLEQLAPLLTLLLRYQTANERAFHKSLATFTALRKAARTAIGFASKKPAAPEMADAFRDIQPPSEAQMNAAGWFTNPTTRSWEQRV